MGRRQPKKHRVGGSREVAEIIGCSAVDRGHKTDLVEVLKIIACMLG
jgi:hypothetical protein